MKVTHHLTQLLIAAMVLAPAPQLQAVTEDEALAAACKGCHQDSGANANRALPDLTKLSKQILFDRLQEYRSGALDGTLMNRIARGYNIDELRRIANTLAAADPTSNQPAP